MSRGWWGWTGHEARRNRDLPASEPVPALPATPEPPQAPTRLPTGVLTWLCATPSGATFAFDSEQAAVNRAAQSDGAVVWPVLVEIEDEERSA